MSDIELAIAFIERLAVDLALNLVILSVWFLVACVLHATFAFGSWLYWQIRK